MMATKMNRNKDKKADNKQTTKTSHGTKTSHTIYKDRRHILFFKAESPWG
jgi:hypothetical protein